ncbi:peptidoglycan-binding domain-containing protein [Stackebrandtia nassauensis]|uniref:Peptidoglycan-binding domain 1 protein n=1 Tax=Stackebrandtia nassauensis (strain DSM 44728 / CIP 108903 / NRRL B-16338 / NBRC 102104 / LLR-40K-21) TaxID=446470 RepID=D3PXF9_STANL|nr:peptidoglycan-binding domain-containing protein [Stackebrandtia nassauensis]ADD41422.1 Peptidoglycan-binding domain 1 protein [Stackebrandtia nassauensis DSM 44728]
MRNRKWKIAAGIGAAALIVGGVAGVAGLANADPTAKSTTFVDGFGNINDDWSDNHREAGVLCDGCDNSQGTDLVHLWQAILAADGYLTDEQIDGYFGPATAKATKQWKADRGLTANGRVGNGSWTLADDYLEPDPELGDEYPIYNGETDGNVQFGRATDATGAYRMNVVVTSEGYEMFNSSYEQGVQLFEETVTWTTE